MIQEALKKIVDGRSLTEAEAMAVMTQIMEGEVSPTVIGGLLTSLRMKGETADEITGFARAMRERSATIDVGLGSEPLLDTCGTSPCGSSSLRTGLSIRAERAAAAWRPSTSRRPRRSWSRAQEYRWRSTGTGA